MKTNRLLLIASLVSAPALLAQSGFTVQSFDPPRSVETHAVTVNNLGAVAGYFFDSGTSLYAGYVRHKNGTFTKPISVPGDNTYAVGLNDSGVIAGYYYPPSPGVETSFLIQNGQMTTVSYPGGLQTQINRINNAGDLTGIYILSSTSNPGFLYSKGTNTWISFTDGAATFGEGLNKQDVVVGEVTTIPYTTFSAFLREANGTIVPLTYPGATQTVANTINDCGVTVGTWFDASSMFHGFYLVKGTYTSFDYPGAAGTAMDGVNDLGELTGSYIDSSSVRHGFFATPSPAGGPTSCKK